MKNLFFLLCFATITCFSACGDDEPNFNQNDLIGTWNMVEFDFTSTTVINDGTENTTTAIQGFGTDFDMQITFTENPNEYSTTGTFQLENTTTSGGQSSTTTENNDEFLGEGTWVLAGNILTISNPDGSVDEATVLELNSTTFRLQQITHTEFDFLGLSTVNDSEGTQAFEKL